MNPVPDGEVDRLLATLESMVVLLRSSDEPFWADWIEHARNEIQRRDAHGLDRLLGAYGGMGSLNDLYLGREAARFDALKDDAWLIARDLRAELRGA
ncbi:DUF6966 domain-containing protein [Demequina zhanjiangensis]|uniref:DUF6966 domain-containing protein n=1 Tax=Demequina zhanjiangensis TaxID=3051659 RepID=A0ABT8G500_9MICO|nr:hypothetical protein [Demequina sp. SYSU T00b26]MDN4474209.1 hypothetical protein [Demequina sp. SYSU T00b26]